MDGMNVTVLCEYFITENSEKKVVLVTKIVLGAPEGVFFQISLF